MMKEYITKKPNINYGNNETFEKYDSINFENAKYNKLLQKLFR